MAIRKEGLTPSEVATARMIDLRRERGWSQQRLAEELASLGVNMHQTTIAKIEKRDRTLSLDDALAIAVALKVAPVHLFVPTMHDESSVRVAPEVVVPAREVREWVRGRWPLTEEDEEDYFTAAPTHEVQAWRDDLGTLEYFMGSFMAAYIDRKESALTKARAELDKTLDKFMGWFKQELAMEKLRKAFPKKPRRGRAD